MSRKISFLIGSFLSFSLSSGAITHPPSSYFKEGVNEGSLSAYFNNCVTQKLTHDGASLETDNIYKQTCPISKPLREAKAYENYVIKVYKREFLDEPIRLETIIQSSLLNDLKQFHFAFPDHVYYVQDLKIYFTRGKWVDGESLSNLRKQDVNLSYVYKRLGRLIGKFHFKYMDFKTIPVQKIKTEDYSSVYLSFSQGDLHWKNIFYTTQEKVIAIIDNASFWPSLFRKKESIFTDLYHITLASSMRYAGGCGHEFNEKRCADTLKGNSQFLRSYLAQFPRKYRKTLKVNLYSYFMNSEKAKFAWNKAHDPFIVKAYKYKLRKILNDSF
jgi:hypothetical protein